MKRIQRQQSKHGHSRQELQSRNQFLCVLWFLNRHQKYRIASVLEQVLKVDVSRSGTCSHAVCQLVSRAQISDSFPCTYKYPPDLRCSRQLGLNKKTESCQQHCCIVHAVPVSEMRFVSSSNRKHETSQLPDGPFYPDLRMNITRLSIEFALQNNPAEKSVQII